MTKPQLHNSHLDMLSRCGIQFQRCYGVIFGVWHEKEIRPPSIALGIGTAVHKSVEKNVSNIIECGAPLALENVREIAGDEFSGIWQGGMLLTEDEALDQKKTFGEAKDMTVRLSALHSHEFAHDIEPIAVEEKFVIELKDYPIDLAGKKDIVESDAIGDVKTMSANNPSVVSMQMAMYSLDHLVKHEKLPGSVYHHKLIKTKIPKAVKEEATPDETWINPLMRRIERFVEIIEAVKSGKQCFTPADPNHWSCSKKYCGWHSDCPFWSGR